jgi:hypothetical protein
VGARVYLRQEAFVASFTERLQAATPCNHRLYRRVMSITRRILLGLFRRHCEIRELLTKLRFTTYGFSGKSGTQCPTHIFPPLATPAFHESVFPQLEQ